MFGRFLLSLVAWIVLGFGLLVPLQPAAGTPYWVEWAVFAGIPFLLIALCMRRSAGNGERWWYTMQELAVVTLVGRLLLDFYYRY